MKKQLALTATVLALFGATQLFAQDDFSSFEDDFGSDDFSSFGSFGDDDSSDFSSGFSSALSAVTITGDAQINARAYLDQKDTDTENSPTSVTPEANLTFSHSNAASDVEIKLNFSKDSLNTYKEDILQEFTARAYLGNWILEGGKMKVVWGKGDKLHVIDNFNATDYTDFLIPDYIDRRIAEPMFRAIYNSPSGLRMEAIYTPTMTGDRYASEGVWVPGQMATLNTTVKTGVMTLLGATPTSTAKLMAASSLDSDDLYPDTKQLKYGQAGVRFTGTLGMFDWGASYYYGRNKKVSVYSPELTAYLTDYVTNAGSTSLSTGIDYDRMQTFGLEGAFVLGPLNTRFEVAYNLTDDVDGDDPSVRNNSISWVPGFDFDLPIHNININVQELGTIILNSDKIKDNGTNDVDRDSDNCYTNNKIAVAISDTFMHENLKLDCTVMYGIERKDFVVMPKIRYTIKTGFDLIGQGLYIWCKDSNSEFYSWENNSFAQVGVKYQF